MDAPEQGDQSRAMNVLIQRRARFDELVALQPQLIRDTIRQILALPQFRLSILYNMAMRSPSTFILFIAFQLTLSGAVVEAVECPEPEYANPGESLDRDFYQYRAYFSVHLNFHELIEDQAYMFLVTIPPNADRGMETVGLAEVYRRSTLGSNADIANRPMADLVRLLRQALPDAGALRMLRPFGHDLVIYPDGFFLFASTFLLLSERASPGMYAVFSYDQDSAASFLLILLREYTGAAPTGPPYAFNVQFYETTYLAIASRICNVMANLGSFRTELVMQFRKVPAPPWSDLSREQRDPVADIDDLRDVLTWNRHQFLHWWDRHVREEAEGESFVREALRPIDLEAMDHLDDELIRMANITVNDGFVHIPRADFVDIGNIVAQMRSYDEVPPAVEGQTQPDDESDDDELAEGERCIVCNRILGNPRPRRELAHTLPCCSAIMGIDCATRWINERGQCPFCRAPHSPLPLLDSGRPPGPGSPSNTGTPPALAPGDGSPTVEAVLDMLTLSDLDSLPDYETLSSDGSPSEPASSSSPVLSSLSVPSSPAAVLSPAHSDESRAGQTHEPIDEQHGWFAQVFAPLVQAQYENLTLLDNTEGGPALDRPTAHQVQALQTWLNPRLRALCQHELFRRQEQVGSGVSLLQTTNF